MGKKFAPEIKAIALQEMARGELRQDVAKKYGCSTAALRSWEQEKKAGESDGFLAAGDGPSPPAGGEPEEGQAASEIPPSPIEPVIDGRKVDQSTQTWLFATNHLNMLYMLSMGVLTGPAGFRGKHYADPSGDVPGWIPLFRGEVPVAVLERCTSEDPKTLHACMAEIDVTLLTGTIQLITREGEVVSTELPSDATAGGSMMLVPAPLPSTLVKCLRFPAEADQKAFTTGGRGDPTLDPSRIPEQQVVPSPSTDSVPTWWPPAPFNEGSGGQQQDRSPVHGQVVAGAMAMFYQLANRCDAGAAAYRILAGDAADADREAIKGDEILAQLTHWLEQGKPSVDAAPRARLYWGAVQSLVDAHVQGEKEISVDTVLAYFDGAMADESNPEDVRKRLGKIVRAMRSVGGLGRVGTVSDLLRHNPGSLSRPLLMLALRPSCKELLEWSLPPETKDEELVLAVILFSAREGGWRKLPTELRAPEGLKEFAEQRIFEIAQRAMGRDLALRMHPPRTQPLRELVAARGQPWVTSMGPGAFGDFARRHGWQDCCITEVRLPTATCKLEVSGSCIQIEFNGLILLSETTIRVDAAAVNRRIVLGSPLPAAVEQELREVLKIEPTSPCA